MSGSTYVDKLKVTTSLRSRELHNRADWVDREMPALIDTVENAALLRTLGIDLVDASCSAPAHGEVAIERPHQ
jgi:hypothetical protein